MFDQTIINSLYRELLFLGMILLVILFYNTLVLYKRKLSDYMSIMIMMAIVMCSFELLWDFFDGNKELKALTYIGACGYAVAFVAWATVFSRFFLEQLNLKIKKKAFRILFFVVPNVVFFLFCITTPWTKLVFGVDENGFTQEMILFQSLYYILLLVYLFAALIPSFRFAFSKRYKDQVVGRVAKSMVVFAVVVPLLYVFQMTILGSDSDYLALSVCCAIALVYLCTNVNTHLLLDSQAKMEAVENDLRFASKIQSDALPPVAPEFADHLDLNLRASMNTAREVGGDFYDYFAIDDHRFCILIADVSGKGTPAALFMMTVKTMIKDYAMTSNSTSEVFTSVNQRLCENNDENMFATAWIGILDTDTMIMQYTNAGHNYPFILHGNESCELLKVNHGLFLAGMDGTKYKQSEIELHGGDRIFLYTDGVTEAHSKDKELYGDDRLKNVLTVTAEESGDAVLHKVFDDVMSFSQGEPQFDDITMMVLTIKKQEG